MADVFSKITDTAIMAGWANAPRSLAVQARPGALARGSRGDVTNRFRVDAVRYAVHEREYYD